MSSPSDPGRQQVGSARRSRQRPEEGASEDAYRQSWQWDKVVWGTHCVDCYPGNCAYRVFVKGGEILREEQGGTYDIIESGVPDMNPMGCQKGAVWSNRRHARDRILYPMKRVGERGGGKWRRISWEDALAEIAFVMSMGIPSTGLRAGPTDLGAANVYRQQYALMLEHTTKPSVFVCDDRADCEAIAAMAAAAAGGMEQLRLNPTLLLYSEPTTPLQHSETSYTRAFEREPPLFGAVVDPFQL